jgi:hypothetical protein
MIRYQYVSVPRRRNPVTVAYSAKDSDSANEIEVTIGASFCSNKDRFNRRSGRQIAEERLNKDNGMTFYIATSDGESFSQAVFRGIDQYVRSRTSDVMQRFCQIQGS